MEFWFKKVFLKSQTFKKMKNSQRWKHLKLIEKIRNKIIEKIIEKIENNNTKNKK